MSLRHVSGSSSLPLPLSIPGQSLPSGGAEGLCENATNPAPLVLMMCLQRNGLLVCSPTYITVGHLLRPVGAENCTWIPVEQRSGIMKCDLCPFPCFGTKEAYCFINLVFTVLSLVDFWISLELQTYLSKEKAACDLPVRDLLWLSVPLCVLASFPKQVNESTIPRVCPATVAERLLMCCILMILVLALLI